MLLVCWLTSHQILFASRFKITTKIPGRQQQESCHWWTWLGLRGLTRLVPVQSDSKKLKTSTSLFLLWAMWSLHCQKERSSFPIETTSWRSWCKIRLVGTPRRWCSSTSLLPTTIGKRDQLDKSRCCLLLVTIIIFCCSDETISSLNYAVRVKKITNNASKARIVMTLLFDYVYSHCENLL